ncbi:hypothetical protein BIFGAL_02548 [Bifidobacterium gallicum DSM 20093 = LMG 11596]|uniref:Uncharacterized protein n=1 Tax=Bifidobacterium gallicum DSM 20093 = LMG 11596 TaxID=561180 RepID=D1NRZ4_9BIFI|nr:hypothetical protein BIFGAL_02548 [Bifidobacterium gallicum DSM 20093 = LMG 11596]
MPTAGCVGGIIGLGGPFCRQRRPGEPAADGAVVAAPTIAYVAVRKCWIP